MRQLFPHPMQSQESDERYTPFWVFEGMVLTFDLDPCAPVERIDRVPAAKRYTRLDDGLAQEWEGMVWVNPPFSNAAAFAYRFLEHRNGVFLGPVANGRWAQDMLAAADLVWLCADFPFDHPTHAGKRSSMPLMFCAIGAQAVSGLRRLDAARLHRGCLMQRVEP